MRILGKVLFLIGVGSIGLYFLNAGIAIQYFTDFEITLPTWFEAKANAIAWAVRSALIVVGGGLWLVGGRSSKEEE